MSNHRVLWFGLLCLVPTFGWAQTFTASDVDFDGSGTVTFGDFVLLASIYGDPDPTADADGDGRVDFDDFLLLVIHYGSVIVESPPASGEMVFETPAGTSHLMALVPGGPFLMGSDSGASNQQPIRTVTIDSFLINVFETTNAQFAAFLNAVGTVDSIGVAYVNLEGRVIRIEETTDGFAPVTPQDGESPVVHVTWVGAQAYCKWMGSRLPTEAEWEKAARGTDGRLYPWGDASPDAGLLNYKKNVGQPLPVGSYPRGVSPYGVHDMAGNVFEWVTDYYDAEYYPSAPDTNPTGPQTGILRVIRGGAHPALIDDWVQTTYRQPTRETQGLVDLGFRCARDL